MERSVQKTALCETTWNFERSDGVVQLNANTYSGVANTWSDKSISTLIFDQFGTIVPATFSIFGSEQAGRSFIVPAL
jgi:hypothetical protein